MTATQEPPDYPVGEYPPYLVPPSRPATVTAAGLHTRLLAFARDCVTHGDMTPSAARMLSRILNETTTADSPAARAVKEIQALCESAAHDYYAGSAVAGHRALHHDIQAILERWGLT